MSEKLLDEIKALTTKIDGSKESVEKLLLEQKAAADKQISAFEKQLDEAKAERKTIDLKHAEDVKGLNEDLAKKGATLEDIQKEVKALKAKGGKFGSQLAENEKKTAVIIAEAFEEHFEEIKAVGSGRAAKFEVKAAGTMTAAANLTGNVVATYDLTPAIKGRRKINLRDLIPVIMSATGVWKFYSEDIPAPTSAGSFDVQTAGAVKNQLAYNLTENTVNANYLAGTARIAKQMLQDLAFMQNFLANEMVEDYKRAESGLFIPTLTAAATAGGSKTSATVPAEKIIDWIAYLMSIDYNPSAIVTDATNWATLLKTKPNDYDVPGGFTITPDGIIQIVGIPLIAQNNIAVGKTLIGDFSKAAIIQAEGLSCNFYEQDQDNVVRNLITVKAEARVGLAILRPDAFIYG